jgi:hypothetical protein
VDIVEDVGTSTTVDQVGLAVSGAVKVILVALGGGKMFRANRKSTYSNINGREVQMRVLHVGVIPETSVI